MQTDLEKVWITELPHDSHITKIKADKLLLWSPECAIGRMKGFYSVCNNYCSISWSNYQLKMYYKPINLNDSELFDLILSLNVIFVGF